MNLSITKINHLLLTRLIDSSDIVIDATCGNGHDTLFLSQIAFHVYAFDIQEQAINHTKEHTKNQKNITYILDSHQNFNAYLSNFRGAIFNLGYLPNGNKDITTHADETLDTIKAMLKVIKKNGFISICVYPGHVEGFNEHILLTEYIKSLDAKIFQVIKIDLPIQDNNPPYLFIITKKVSN